MSSPSAKAKDTNHTGGGGSKEGEAASRSSNHSTCGTETAHKHAGTSSNASKANNGSPQAETYSMMERYLASLERHKRIAVEAETGSSGPKRADSGYGRKS
ncbi:hypothetical protein LTR36_003287 [Oleoguttula mirabilis]|uniref:Uncharacterized protein n=1 Tax=Oleoguttula mirabilis TaxID=1507867 RepID=A0AAV9JXM5_9PEZI|nr:hypothetical protein LTR36_003287 [Oleoguttula mirabilis]